jgi:chromosomal replication initiator protein
MTAIAETQAEELPLWMNTAAAKAQDEWWIQVRAKVRERIGPVMFERWFSQVTPVGTEGRRVILRVPNLMHLYWIEDNFKAALSSAVAEVFDSPQDVELLATSEDARPEPVTKPSNAKHAVASGNSVARSLLTAGIYSHYSFDSFVVSSSSSYSCAAAKAVADKPGKTYNPLFVHGGAGLGKTHLMQAIGHDVLRRNPGKNVRYVTSESFTNEYIEALRRGGVTAFRQKYRQVDVLLIDDVHFLGGKQSTQEEFFHTFNDLHLRHKQIVLASDKAPSEIANLEARLVSRFEWGLATRIQAPDLETRIAILHQKMLEWTVRMDEWMVNFVAERIQHNVRRLEGALMRVAAHISMGAPALNETTLASMLHDIIEEAESRSISIDYIQKIVAEHFDIRLADMTSPRRPKSIAEPRQIAMYLARQLTKNSLMDIGDAFGGRDHGTIIHACKQVTKRLDSEDFRRTINTLTEKIKRI